MKVFRNTKSDDDSELVSAANEFLEDMKIDCPVEIEDPPTQTDYTEGSADKSPVFEGFFS